MISDNEYTLEDHRFRDDDQYALSKYNLTLRWLQGRKIEGRLLNVGCGSGVFNDLAAKAGYAVIGAEPEPVAWKLASQRAGGRYDVVNRGLFELGSDLASDVVVMHDVLEHIDAEGAAVDALAELVSPGGVAVVSVPALELLFGYHDRQLGHYRRYTVSSLRRALRPRFEVEKCRYFGVTGIPLALWYSRLKNEPYPFGSTGRVMKRLVSAACAVEERLPSPFGTSVLALARRRD